MMTPLLLTLRRVYEGARSRIRNLWFRSLGMRIDGYAWIRKVDIPRGHSHIHFSNGVALDTHVSIICTASDKSNTPILAIGERSYINRQTIIDASHSIRIGQDCMIGPFCYITDHDHVTNGKDGPSCLGLIERETVIGDCVWLGAHVTVLKGVHIGDGAVVGAGSVVTKDLPAGVTAVGVPAKIVRPCHPCRNDKMQETVEILNS